MYYMKRFEHDFYNKEIFEKLQQNITLLDSYGVY